MDVFDIGDFAHGENSASKQRLRRIRRPSSAATYAAYKTAGGARGGIFAYGSANIARVTHVVAAPEYLDPFGHASFHSPLMQEKNSTASGGNCLWEGKNGIP